jgi:anti-sigma regulatory factor (Ser/Thr protein kinase)
MEEFLFRLPPDFATLAELRRDLATWLRQLDGIAEQDVVGLVLATHEAAANAIEHSADAFGPGQVNAWLIEGVLTVEVRDSGRWKRSQPDEERGRGHTLIENLVDEVRIMKNSRGTTLRLVRSVDDRRTSRAEVEPL